MKSIVLSFTASLVIALILSYAGSTGGAASAMIDIDAFRVEAPVLGYRVQIDQRFAETHQVPIHAPFEFYIPNRRGIEVFAAFPPDTDGALVNLSFATGEKELVESLWFTTMTVPFSSLDSRIEMVARLLTDEVLPQATEGTSGLQILGVRRSSLKGLKTVEVAAQCDHPAWGRMYLWLVGILNPDSEDSVLALSRIVPGRSDVNCYYDIGRKGMAARALGTFRFLSD